MTQLFIDSLKEELLEEKVSNILWVDKKRLTEGKGAFSGVSYKGVWASNDGGCREYWEVLLRWDEKNGRFGEGKSLSQVHAQVRIDWESRKWFTQEKSLTGRYKR